jgi:hypothetical protein
MTGDQARPGPIPEWGATDPSAYVPQPLALGIAPARGPGLGSVINLNTRPRPS